MPAPKRTPAPVKLLWVAGDWRTPSQHVNPFGGAVVTDCISGDRFHIPGRVTITHVPGPGDRCKPVPAVRAQIVDQVGDIARVRFANGTIARVRLPRRDREAAA